MEQDPKELRLSVSNIADLFGVTERSIANWAAEGMPFVRIKGKVNRYPWRPCLEWWLANRYTGPTAADRPNRPPSKAESEARLLNIKTEREQMRLDTERGLLIPLEAIEPAWLQASGIVKDRVLGIANALKLAIPALTQHEVEKVRQVCREALSEIEACPSLSPDRPTHDDIADP